MDLPAKFQVKRTDIREMMPNFDEAFRIILYSFVRFDTKHTKKKIFS